MSEKKQKNTKKFGKNNKNNKYRKKVLKKVISEKIRKGEKLTKTNVMQEAGYSKSYAESGHSAKTWEELIEEYIPDDLVTQTHKDLFHASRIETQKFPINTENDFIYLTVISMGGTVIRIEDITKGFNKYKQVTFFMPDYKARDNALDKALKVKGKYAPERHVFEDPLSGLSDDELKERQREIDNMLSRYDESDPSSDEA